MATLPTPGGDSGTWGTELNEFLEVSLASDGKVKNEALQSLSTAPVADAALANKKYVDDQITAGNPIGDAPTVYDSEPTAMLKDHSYKVQTAGFVNARVSYADRVFISVGVENNPTETGVRVAAGNTAGDTISESFGMAFVPKDYYFKVTGSGTITIYWTPLISGGGAPVDQD